MLWVEWSLCEHVRYFGTHHCPPPDAAGTSVCVPDGMGFQLQIPTPASEKNSGGPSMLYPLYGAFDFSVFTFHTYNRWTFVSSVGLNISNYAAGTDKRSQTSRSKWLPTSPALTTITIDHSYYSCVETLNPKLAKSKILNPKP